MRRSTRDNEFAEFVAAQRDQLMRVARLLTTGDEPAAEDLVQLTLTKLYVAWARVQKAGNPVGYARRTLSNAFLDERRHRRHQVEVISGDPTAGVESSASHTGDVDPTLRATVLTALAGLPPRQRAVVVLRHWLDLDVAETAHTLGCSEGTVKSQNSKALAHLRDALSPHLILEDA